MKEVNLREDTHYMYVAFEALRELNNHRCASEQLLWINVSSAIKSFALGNYKDASRCLSDAAACVDYLANPSSQSEP